MVLLFISVNEIHMTNFDNLKKINLELRIDRYVDDRIQVTFELYPFVFFFFRDQSKLAVYSTCLLEIILND